MPNVFNDGDVPFGSSLITIGSDNFVAEEIDIEDKVTSVIRRDEQNIPNGAVHIKDLVKGKVTLQLNSIGDALPEINTVASLPFRGVAKDFVITGASQPQKQDQIRKMKIDVTEVLNP